MSHIVLEDSIENTFLAPASIAIMLENNQHKDIRKRLRFDQFDPTPNQGQGDDEETGQNWHSYCFP